MRRLAPAFLLLGLGATAPLFAGLSFTCAANVNTTEAGTCAYLNSTIAPLYNDVFSNLNASIYVQMGVTGLGENYVPDNYIAYSTYVADLTANADNSGNPVEKSAVNALTSNDAATYGLGYVQITGALGQALGISPTDLNGYLINGDTCTGLGSGSKFNGTYCYDDIITITTPANLSSETDHSQYLWWRQEGGSIPSDAYDFYSVVEHETDEALGTASCINTQTTPLSDYCDQNDGFGNGTTDSPGTPSAADLFRYSAYGSLIVDSSVMNTDPDANTTAYFSYDGGQTNGANGAYYNTLDNGDDWADYSNNCQFVQDETGCPGKSFNITDGAEIPILNAEGFEVYGPEPGTIFLFGVGLAALGFGRRIRRTS